MASQSRLSPPLSPTARPAEFLPPDILHLIAQHLASIGNLYTLLQLALASKPTFSTAAPVLYKILYLTPGCVRTMESALATVKLPSATSPSPSPPTTPAARVPPSSTPADRAMDEAQDSDVTVGQISLDDWLLAQAWHASPGIRLLKCLQYTEVVKVWDGVLGEDARHWNRVATDWARLHRDAVLMRRCKSIVVLPGLPPVKVAQHSALASSTNHPTQSLLVGDADAGPRIDPAGPSDMAVDQVGSSTGGAEADHDGPEEMPEGSGTEDDDEWEGGDNDEDDEDDDYDNDDESEQQQGHSYPRQAPLIAALTIATEPKHVCERQPLIDCLPGSIPVLPKEEPLQYSPCSTRDARLHELRSIATVETLNCHDVSYRPFDLLPRRGGPSTVTVAFTSAVRPIAGQPMQPETLQMEMERYHRKRLRHLVELAQATMLVFHEEDERELVIINPAGHLGTDGPLATSAGAAGAVDAQQLSLLDDEIMWEFLAMAEFEEQYDGWAEDESVPALEECKTRIRIVRKAERALVPLCPACGESA